jgi:hypothetical protein
MRQLKRLFLIVAGLTFVGGIGTGAWIGTLLAAPPKPAAKLDRRVQDFEHYFPDLDATQKRQLREASRKRIRLILTDPQRTEYDKLVGSR